MPKLKKEGFAKQRESVVNSLVIRGYIKDPAIKRAMLKVKREDFVAPECKDASYVDTPLPIPGSVTISAPHMHAIFMEVLKLKAGDKVLEVGAGSGILLAYMKEVVGPKGKIYGVEIIKETYEFAKKNLEKAGYGKKIKLVLGDGSLGLSKYAPYDKIICSASCPEVPKPWIEQLKIGGLIATPVGPPYAGQDLIVIRKISKDKVEREEWGGVIFVPLTGKHGFKM